METMNYKQAASFISGALKKGRLFSPEPAERVGEDAAAVIAVVRVGGRAEGRSGFGLGKV